MNEEAMTRHWRASTLALTMVAAFAWLGAAPAHAREPALRVPEQSSLMITCDVSRLSTAPLTVRASLYAVEGALVSKARSVIWPTTRIANVVSPDTAFRMEVGASSVGRPLALLIESEASAPCWRLLSPPAIGAESRERRLRLELEEVITLRGRVVGAGGQPVQGAFVESSSLDATHPARDALIVEYNRSASGGDVLRADPAVHVRTDEKGAFVISNIGARAAFTLRARAGGHFVSRVRSMQLSTPEGERVLRLRAPASVELRLQVKGELTRPPMSGGVVEVIDARGALWSVGVPADPGTLTLRGLSWPSFSLVITAPGLVSVRRTIALDPGERSILDVSLIPSVRRVGTVQDCMGRPVVGARVVGTVEGRDASSGDVTDEAGRFSVEGLPSGATRFQVFIQDTLVVDTGKVPDYEHVDVSLPPLGSVSLEVRNLARGGPFVAPQYIAILDGPVKGFRHLSSDTRGRAYVGWEALVPGDYALSVEVVGGMRRRIQFSVRGAESVDLGHVRIGR